MFSIPLYAALIIYFIFLFIFLLFFITNLLHIILTGTTTFASFIVTLIVFVLTILTIFITWKFLQNTDWTQSVTIWDSSWLSSLNNTIQ